MNEKPTKAAVAKSESLLRDFFKSENTTDPKPFLVQDSDLYDVVLYYLVYSFANDTTVDIPAENVYLHAVIGDRQSALRNELDFERMHFTVETCKEEIYGCDEKCEAKNADKSEYNNFECYLVSDEYLRDEENIQSLTDYADSVIGDFTFHDANRIKEWSVDLR